MSVLNLKSLEDTSLRKMLDQYSGEHQSVARTLAANLPDICDEAIQRSKAVPVGMPQYTLHDGVHFLRVTELMSMVMPEKVRNELNPAEIALLILSAFFHDQGMVLEADELNDLENRPDFRLDRENWKLDHPNWGELEARLKDRNLSDTERQRLNKIENELKAAHLTDFIRKSHAERSARFVRAKYSSDKRWGVGGKNLADLVARLSESHVRPATDLNETNRFRDDESVGTFRVNMVYLGLVLRLADILDFDRDRTPETLYRTIDFRSNVSIEEWAKHMSVEGWVIEPNLVRFTMECEHPEYQRAALKFMDWIDDELKAAQAITAKFPSHVNRYFFELPPLVDRTRITPKHNAYIYHDLEFSLSRNEVVNLLMTDELYGSPVLCIRELVQNAMDALRHRAAIFERDNDQKWTGGKVTMIHELDEHGHEVVRCTDNGIGMTQEIIENFLTNVGRSYYRSPEWEQERNSLKAKGVDFDPCAQFGIGFMSCFMLGDQIKIETRRFKGRQGEGEPIVVEINGLGGIVVIRKGYDSQDIGTTISITGRKKPRFLNKKNDKVQLVETLNAYILNCEFPVEGKCAIEEITALTKIPVGFEKPIGWLRKLGLSNLLIIEQPFDCLEIHSSKDLKGLMVAEFIVDDQGQLTLENEEAVWTNRKKDEWHPNSRDKKSYLAIKNPSQEKITRWRRIQISADGIYIMGEAGRYSLLNNKWNEKYIKNYDSDSDAVGYNFNSSDFSYILDTRGIMKPPLTPARSAKEEAIIAQINLVNIPELCAAKIWEKVLARKECSYKQDVVWSLLMGHDFDVSWLPSHVLFNFVSIPIITYSGDRVWRFIKDLPDFCVLKDDTSDEKVREKRPNAFTLNFEDGSVVNSRGWLSIGEPTVEKSKWMFAEIIGGMSTLILRDGDVHFRIQEPTQPDSTLYQFIFLYKCDYILVIPYAAEASSFLSIHCPCISANRSHPLAQEAAKNTLGLEPSRFNQLPEDLVWLMSHPENEDILVGENEYLHRWYIEIAHQVLETDWGNSGLGPPYKVRLLDGSEVTLTNETFEKWIQAKPILDEEDED